LAAATRAAVARVPGLRVYCAKRHWSSGAMVK
jgi:hypothetical protein